VAESGDRIRIGFNEAEDFLLAHVPEFREEYESLFPPDMRDGVTYTVFGAFAGWVSKRLAAEARSVDVVRRIFQTIETLANSDDPRTENLVAVGFLERLQGESPEVIELSRTHYGPRTSLLDHEVTDYWETFDRNRPVLDAIRRLDRDLMATGVRFAVHYELTDLGADETASRKRTSSSPSAVPSPSPSPSWRVSWKVSLKSRETDLRVEVVVTGVSQDLILGELAFVLQNRIAVELGSRWPSCPRHPHSLEPGMVDGRATWRCSIDQAIATPIGRIGSLK